MEYKNERWKDIKELNNLYEISDYGRIRNKNTGKIRSHNLKNKNAYYTDNFYIKGKRITLRPHRLVARYFVDNPNDYNVVNHIDMNKQNNYYKNLEWCTTKYNQNEALKKKPQMINGLKNYNKYLRPKTIVQTDKNNNFIALYPNAQIASKVTGICSRNILQVADKTPFNEKGLIRKSAGGYKWYFGDEVIDNGI